MTRPNFFIVGAPKCGTTALANYLRDLDEVFLTDPKEPHFFAADLPGYQQTKSIEEYELIFGDVAGQTMLGEASVFYLFSEVALSNIAQFNPDAKLIVMLRNPVDLVYSLHSQLLFTRDENIADFGEAWRKNEVRRGGDQIPRRCRDSKLLQYDKVAMLGEQLQRLYQFFPRENVTVVFFEDFIANTEREFRRVAEFLGVANQERTHFPRINGSRRHRSLLLANILFDQTRRLRRPVAWIKSTLGIREFGLLNVLRGMEVKQEVRAQLSPALRDEIRANYAEDIDLLEGLVDRKLDHWN